MFDVRIAGLDELNKISDDVQRAIKSLDGDIAKLSVDPNNPQGSLAEMERVIDAKLRAYRGNAIVDKIAQASREKFRTHILQQAEKAKRAQ